MFRKEWNKKHPDNTWSKDLDWNVRQCSDQDGIGKRNNPGKSYAKDKMFPSGHLQDQALEN